MIYKTDLKIILFFDDDQIACIPTIKIFKITVSKNILNACT